MRMKKHFFATVLFIVAFFSLISGVNAAEADTPIFDIDISTDQESYNHGDEVQSKITITNISNRYSGKNLEVKTNFPEDLDILDEDIELKDGQIIWNVEGLERGDSVEFTYTSKLKQSVIDEMNEEDNTSTPPPAVDKGEDQDKGGTSEKPKEETSNTIAPQTGDDTSLMKYWIILLVSLVTGVFAFIAIRKKRIPKTAPLLLALAMLLPAYSVAHAEGTLEQENIHTLTKSHHISIGERQYDFKTTVTAEIHDNRVEIPVTGTAYNEDGQLLTNHELTFTTTIDEEIIQHVVETDDEGYFLVRLIEDATYKVQSVDLVASVIANGLNDIKVENGTGKIELGKTLSNGNNHSTLQPSAIYLADEDASKFTNLSDDLTKATLSEALDIRANDFIVLPEWEGFPEGIAFQVESVHVQDGQVTLNLAEPELEDIFSEIIGDLEVDVNENNFIPAEGIQIEPDAGIEPRTFSMFQAAESRASIGNKVTLRLDNIYKDEEFSIGGSLELSGKLSGDIEWRLGFNPVQSFDFNFQGEQKINAEMKSSVTKTFKPIPLGKIVIPTQIPGLAVSVPFDLVSSATGKVSVVVSAGVRENFGIAYERGSGIRTYPEEHFDPYFSGSDVNGTGSISSGVRMSVLVRGLGWDLAGAGLTGSLTGSATTSILGGNGLFQCIGLAASFDGKLNLRAPIVKWESKGSVNVSKSIWSKTFGSCVSSITANPAELEMSPGETKSITVVARDNTKEAGINDAENLKFKISDPDSIKVKKQSNRVDIIATDAAQDGDVITVKAFYDQQGREISDTVTVKIVDDREKGDLIGEVVDAVEETPLQNASVKVYKEDRVVAEIQTAENGTYKTRLSPGTYKVEVSYPGYITDTSNIKITSANTTTYDSKLQLVGEEHGGIGTASGQIQNALTGFGVAGVKIEIRKGKNETTGDVVKTITTDDQGNYAVELPGGNYTMALSAEGYIPTHANILAIGDQERPDQNATISPDGVLDDNLRIVLTWGESPRDLDSHLTGPKADGGRFHIWYADKKYQDEANDVNLDRDDVTSYGPETVTVINRLQMGTYTYAIHNYTGRYLDEENQSDLANSSARVQIYRGNTLLETYNVPVNQAGNSWRVFEIRDGEIVTINKMETIEDWRSADAFAPMN
ncbi:carboxypeptidase regulatory-like domain-containing protein [Bacillus niameyensis]|uniref:carboxypeptidase regulatory-like domain-containing protein n=1 Tax=Bacillus niameyensis TaxID=1522308 RepID=UPI000782ACB6|nr:carboxypeptidase regulatory-like domain-containing protein [Bacillus niameyensis]